MRDGRDIAADAGLMARVQLSGGSYQARSVIASACLWYTARMTGAPRHYLTGHPLHNKWKGMLTRCLNSNHPGFKNYGGRGIKICDRWLIFENFRDDMGSA